MGEKQQLAPINTSVCQTHRPSRMTNINIQIIFPQINQINAQQAENNNLSC